MSPQSRNGDKAFVPEMFCSLQQVPGQRRLLSSHSLGQRRQVGEQHPLFRRPFDDSAKAFSLGFDECGRCGPGSESQKMECRASKSQPETLNQSLRRVICDTGALHAFIAFAKVSDEAMPPQLIRLRPFKTAVA